MAILLRLFLLAAVAMLPVGAMAEVLEIQLVDVDLDYDAQTGVISDDGVANDALSGAFFFVDGAEVGSLSPPDEDVSLDLTIPGVFDIDAGGDTVVSATGGSLELLAPGSILSLSLDAVEVVYSPLSVGPVVFDFVFTGTIGAVESQNLPFDLKVDSPVTVTFSMQASDLTTSNDTVQSFKASGTGELIGDLDLTPDNEVPEPMALVTLALAATLTSLATRQR